MPTPVPGQKDPGTSNSEAVTSGSQASLGQDEVNKILKQAEDASNRTFSMEGLRTTPQTKRTCKEMICVVDRNGKILGHKEMPDGWIGSIDIALGKARTAVFFSSDENALSSRQVGQLAQAHGPDGNGQAGPLWGIWATNQDGGKRADQVERNCIVTFPGGLPLYKQGHLVGAIGVSGDGVDQDESIAFGGAQGYMPAPSVGSPTPLVPKPVDWKTPGQ
jgi:uncharacterized protein GlcG (DUF336 family)